MDVYIATIVEPDDDYNRVEMPDTKSAVFATEQEAFDFVKNAIIDKFMDEEIWWGKKAFKNTNLEEDDEAWRTILQQLEFEQIDKFRQKYLEGEHIPNKLDWSITTQFLPEFNQVKHAIDSA